MGIQARRLQSERFDAGRDFHDRARRSVGLHAGLGAGGAQDRLVESSRRLLQIAQRRGRFAGVVELRLLDAARGAVEHVRLHFRGPRGRKLAVGEVEEQVLGLGAVHALPSRTPGGGSGSASSAVTPSSASALRSPRRA